MLERCVRCSREFEVSEEDLKFLDRISPSVLDRKLPIPPPSQCPDCRLQRRLAFRNQNYCYLRPSSSSGKMIFSMFTEDVPFPVIEKEMWWSDEWDALSYGLEFDFSLPFFYQFEKLFNKVPQYPLSALRVENCDFCNNLGECKNCYFVFNTGFAEDCIYCENIWHARDCIDCTRCPSCELCYDCTGCTDCYNLQSSKFCENCSDSWYLVNCRSCRNCFGCVNLNRAEYCIYNQQHTRSEFEEFIAGLELDSWKMRSEMGAYMRDFELQHPFPHFVGLRIENISGNYISESKNVRDSYFVRGAENVHYGFNIDGGVKDCLDYSLYGDKSELMYECAVTGGNSYNLRFCHHCYDNVSDLIYCASCVSSKRSFGCVALRNKEHCILNKQYSEQDYNELLARIISHMIDTGEWGEFFPMHLSPIPYNHSLAHRYFPMSKAEILESELRYHEMRELKGVEAVPAAKLPDRLPASDNSIAALSAENGQPFKITSQEISRYRKLKAPIPRLTPNERMDHRSKLLGGIQLHRRECQKTGRELLSTYPPESPVIVWDKEVYDREIAG